MKFSLTAYIMVLFIVHTDALIVGVQQIHERGSGTLTIN